jgi:hypothetical protein
LSDRFASANHKSLVIKTMYFSKSDSQIELPLSPQDLMETKTNPFWRNVSSYYIPEYL